MYQHFPNCLTLFFINFFLALNKYNQVRFYKLFAYILYYTKEVYIGYTKLQISLHFLLLLQVMALYGQRQN